MSDDAPKKPAPPKVEGSRPPPPMAAKIADVIPYDAPYEPPPGALSAPRQRPIWRSNGKETGQLVAPSAPLPKTVELLLPEARPSAVPSAIPLTRELEPPPEGASGLFAESTFILSEAQLRGDAPARQQALEPDIDDDERTDEISMKALQAAVAGELSTIDDSDAFDDFDDPTAPQQVISFYDESTAILSDRELPDDEDG
jgi:hypothetical protein